MRRDRRQVFVIGEERMLDEEEHGADAAMPVMSRERRHRRAPLNLRRWAARGGAITSTLIVGVLMVSALLRGGEGDRPAPTVAQLPGEPSEADPPLRGPHASRGRERPREAVSSGPERAEGEPERREQSERDAGEDETTPAELPAAPPPSEVDGAAATPATAPAAVSAPARAPSTPPAPSPAASSGGGAPAVASASQVRQEFGP